MRRLGLTAVCMLSLFSCSTTNHEESQRNVANSDSEAFVSKEDYYAHRGQKKSIKWSYDGYHAQVTKFLGAVKKKENIKFLKTGTSLRQNLFENNLIDTGVDSATDNFDCNEIMYMPRRTPEGRCYLHGIADKMAEQDIHLAEQVYMGSKGQRFGRNASQDHANNASKLDIMDPNPFKVSQKLFTRENAKTKEATVLNLLAAAWLQAMNHDWFTHGKNSKSKHHSVEGYSGHKSFKNKVKIPHTRSETEGENATDKNGYHYTSRNQVTHWWDASQIYGSDAKTIKAIRTAYNSDGSSQGKLLANGKIAVDTKNRRLIYNQKTQLPITGFHDNWWLGLEMIHTLFHLEHNKIIDEVLMPQVKKGKFCKGLDSTKCSDKLFEVARLINSALIAKIHTVEWTPALLNHPMLHIAMRANWFGLREIIGGDSERLRKKISRSTKHVASGLVGPVTLDLYKAPFTLTEEFVAVYRMHPLIPESIKYRSPLAPEKFEEVPVEDVVFRKANNKIKTSNAKTGSSLDWMFSFGTSHPGGLVLNNYPSFMQDFVAERNTGPNHNDSVRMDMGAIDILRDRERGVPRYNNFRRALGLPPIKTFEDLFDSDPTDDKTDVSKYAKEIATMKEVYDNDVEKIDLLVGSLAEQDRYPGYAFGNTPFWIFAIMASRRLMADPFFSDYFIDDVYTKNGIKYVQKTTMTDVIVSHYPELESKFYDVSYRYQVPGSKIWRTRKPGQVQKGDKKRRRLRVKNAFRPWKPVFEEVEKTL